MTAVYLWSYVLRAFTVINQIKIRTLYLG